MNDSIGYCYDTSGLGSLDDQGQLGDHVQLAPLNPDPLDTYTYTINYTQAYRPDPYTIQHSVQSVHSDIVSRDTPPPPYTSFSSPSPCSSSSSSSLSPQEISSPVKYNRSASLNVKLYLFLIFCFFDHNSGNPELICPNFDWGTRETHGNFLRLVLRF